MAFGSLDLLVITWSRRRRNSFSRPRRCPGSARRWAARCSNCLRRPAARLGGHPRAGTERAARRSAGRGPRRAGPSHATRPPGL